MKKTLATLLLEADIELCRGKVRLHGDVKSYEVNVLDRMISKPRPLTEIGKIISGLVLQPVSVSEDVFIIARWSEPKDSVNTTLGRVADSEKLRIRQVHIPEGSGGKACHW